MAHTECPRCRRKTVEVVAGADGVPEKSRCNSCGWEGPKCFAQKWDPNSPKCQGGADPTNWENGTHVRQKCSFEVRCRTAQDRANKEQLIPTMSVLTRPRQQVEVSAPTNGMYIPQQTPVMAPTAPQQMVTRQQVQSMQSTLRPVTVQHQQVVTRPVQPTQGQVYPVQAPMMGSAMAWVPPEHAAAPTYVPQNYPQPGMQVPAYLTNPEPVGQSIVPLFLNSMFRAAFKGAFHTAANLMDHVPWGSYPAPSTTDKAG